MGKSVARDSIENHGTAIDDEKKRVRCNYCRKELPGFDGLKHHLGGVGSDVAACLSVPADVKRYTRNSLLEKKKDKVVVDEVDHLPLKRRIPSSSGESRRCQPRLSRPASSTDGNGCVPAGAAASSSRMGNNVVDPSQVSLSGTHGDGGDYFITEEEDIGSSSTTLAAAAKSVGRFFYEAGIDPSAVRMPSFQKMFDAAIKCGTGFKVPKYNELRGWVLKEDLEEVRERVEDAKRYWPQTGCTIVLDISTDQSSGRTWIGFLVDCPQDTVFLKSVDATDAIGDANALVSLLSPVIEEVGALNVVQIITHDDSCYMEAAGKMLAEKYNIFWTRCADYCINLILERLESMDHVKMVLDGAKTITRFLYSDDLLLELMRKFIIGRELVRSSMLKSVVPFLTLENMVSERENLVRMVTSEAWSTSPWSSETKGERVCDLVMDSSFWAAAVDILKIADPVIGVLRMMHESEASPIGFLYEAMDAAKEEVRKNLGGEDATYVLYWDIIDEIWNNHLHSDLHSAAYYLNPYLFYSNDFFVDSEVTNGTFNCMVRLSENQTQKNLIVEQLETYRAAHGGFSEDMPSDLFPQVPPAFWWSLHGSHCPELQKFAIKIHSQICSSNSRHKLRKGVSGRLHANAQNSIEQQRLTNMEFVRKNRCLWQPPCNRDQRDDISLLDIPALNDWIVEDM